MLQANARLAWIFDGLHLPGRHGRDKGPDRRRRRHVVLAVDDYKRGKRQASRANRLSADFKGATAKTILTIEPIEDLMDQPPGERHLVE